MVNKTYLLVWYSTMMHRIEMAGRTIVRGHYEDTVAARKSRQILTRGWTETQMLDKQTQYQIQDPLVTWINPFDGANISNHVSIMACLIESGRVEAGILHFPFIKETWAAADGTWLERPAIDFNPPPDILVPTTYPSKIDNIASYHVSRTSGAGYKAAEIMKGNAMIYIDAKNTNTWDICAIESFAQAINTPLVEWTVGSKINYTHVTHPNGIFFSTTVSRQWLMTKHFFGWTGVRFFLFIIAWCLIYAYPTNKHAPTTNKMNKCMAGLIVSHLALDTLYKHIVGQNYEGDHFRNVVFMVFITNLLSSTITSYYVEKQTTPFSSFLPSSFSNVLTTICQYSIVLQTSFPILTVLKSLKMIPVLLIGKFFFRKKYNVHAYTLALLLGIGVTLSFLSNSKKRQLTNTQIASTLACVLFEAIHSQWQSFVFKRDKTSPLEMMWGVTTGSTVISGTLLLFTGQIEESIYFGKKHYVIIFYLTNLCMVAIVCHWFIFKIINDYGPATFSMVMTGQQSISLLSYCVVFNHTWDFMMLSGVFIVIVVFILQKKIELEQSQDDNKII